MHRRPLSISVFPEALFIHAADAPDGFACQARGERLTWRELADGALRAAAALRRRGVGRGDRCAVVLPSSIDFLCTFLGAQLAGAVPVALRAKQPAAQLRRRLREVQPRVIVADAGAAAALTSEDGGSGGAPLAPLLDAGAFRTEAPLERREVRLPGPDDLSHLQITSGTTGEPRAAMLTHGNVAAAVRSAYDVLDPRADDIFVGWVPLYHDLGLVRFVFEPIYFGCGTYLIEPSLPTLPAWIETISSVGGTVTAAPDFAYRLASRLVDPARVNLQSLRIASNGGEAVRFATIQAFETRFNCPGVVHPGYGMAETTLGVASVRAGEPIDVDASGAVSCGQLLQPLQVRILDDDDRECGPGERGRIVVRGPMVFAGYFNDPESTAAVLRDGWLDTGDDGALGREGQLFIHGRRRAMIKRAGASIAPREIEEVVDEVSGVRRSAAIGVDTHDAALTEDIVVIAEVERSVADARYGELREAIALRVREVIGSRPHDVLLVEPNVIPKTASGKTRYGALKAEWPALRAQPAARG